MAERFCLLESLSEQINIRLYVFLKGCDFFVPSIPPLVNLRSINGVVNGLGELMVVLLSDSSERVEGWYFTPLPCLAGSEYIGLAGCLTGILKLIND
jgi:hypothetical protein